MKLNNLMKRFIVKNLNRVAGRFQSSITKMIQKNPVMFDESDAGTIMENDIVIDFGGRGLPHDDNVVYVGNAYHGKKEQYQKFIGKVNTIKTYEDYVHANQYRFIAKKNHGEHQDGQHINKVPDNPREYIYQDLVTIEAEFRVVVFYMNGDYHVSGIYKKSGSNVSLSQLSVSSNLGKKVAETAIKATSVLGYGLGGVDIAIVSSSNKSSLELTENITGKVLSGMMKISGSMKDYDDMLDNHYVVVLEVNTFPSMANPAIGHNLLQSMNKVRYSYQ